MGSLVVGWGLSLRISRIKTAMTTKSQTSTNMVRVKKLGTITKTTAFRQCLVRLPQLDGLSSYRPAWLSCSGSLASITSQYSTNFTRQTKNLTRFAEFSLLRMFFLDYIFSSISFPLHTCAHFLDIRFRLPTIHFAISLSSQTLFFLVTKLIRIQSGLVPKISQTEFPPFRKRAPISTPNINRFSNLENTTGNGSTTNNNRSRTYFWRSRTTETSKCQTLTIMKAPSRYSRVKTLQITTSMVWRQNRIIQIPTIKQRYMSLKLL